ncbi:ribosome maturation factor RimP [Chitinibacter tainanensis]|uniref:ribosome maturation factor RimP n=1 Tax=Chitinibacter tainanensis TaxID=230667 RepID=UPI0004014399|nr:ribosome maturation factor RimP [Chitinibacter tainanensis]
MAVNLQSVLDNTLPAMGYELVDFELGANGLMRIFIDKEGGVTIDDCVEVSNHLTRLFMVEEIPYERLEVSSPGMDRLIKKPADFERFAGQKVRVKLRLPLPDRRRNLVGLLKGFIDECVVVDVDGEVLNLPLSQIDRVRLEPQF